MSCRTGPVIRIDDISALVSPCQFLDLILCDSSILCSHHCKLRIRTSPPSLRSSSRCRLVTHLIGLPLRAWKAGIPNSGSACNQTIDHSDDCLDHNIHKFKKNKICKPTRTPSVFKVLLLPCCNFLTVHRSYAQLHLHLLHHFDSRS